VLLSPTVRCRLVHFPTRYSSAGVPAISRIAPYHSLNHCGVLLAYSPHCCAVRCGVLRAVQSSAVILASLTQCLLRHCRGAPTRMALIPLWRVTSVESLIHHHNCLAVKRAKKCKMKKLKAVRSKPRLEAVCTKDGRHFQQCFQLTLLVSGSLARF
jgi:hypothetical protein